MEVEFSIKQCVSDPTSVTSQCKETFNIFYYEVDSDVATTTFPPWREQPYVKIDTVAANSINQVNSKSFSFGPIHRKGIYLAVQDQGACMSLISIRLYYFYCHKIAKNLALFPMTISGETPASLVEVKGSCVTNARQPHVLENPMYRCNSNGLWQISTGGCVCLAGYQANMEQTRCQPCPDGTYKSTESISQCLPCPAHSGYNATLGLSPPSSTGGCVCHPGYARAPTEGLEIPCTS
uniref:Eph LBD domain-containing protein n=1 Tax=Ciona savignyi TaxID=51511 RepID=H2YTV7_CIOSA